MINKTNLAVIAFIFSLLTGCSHAAPEQPAKATTKTPAKAAVPGKAPAKAAVPASASDASVAALPSSARALRIDLKKDCGAKGDGVTNDTSAFQKASQLLQAKGGGTLTIPKATYIVGWQTHEAGKFPYYQSQPILQLRKIKGLLIEGNNAKMKLAPGLRFGSFDKETGEVYGPKLPFYDSDYAVNVGCMVQVSDSEDIVVRNLELDGNISGLKLGGGWGDTGRQLWAYGLHFYGNRNVHLDKLCSHHHGLDGLIVGHAGLKEADPATNVTLTDSRFEYNARQGLSWVGGRGLKALRCKFNHTGRAVNNGTPVGSSPGAGLDIEAEESVARDGYFEGCEFINNIGPGMVADSGDGGCARFKNCTFWGTTNWSVWAAKPGLKFEDSRLYGSAVHAFGSDDPKLATTYTGCSFEDKPWQDGKVYRQNSSAYLVELNGKLQNVKFDACIFIANTCKSVWIDAHPSARPTLNNCTLTHKKSDLLNQDFQALLRNVVISETHFKEDFPQSLQRQWSIEAQAVSLGTNVSVQGPRIKWQNWSWGKTGTISPSVEGSLSVGLSQE